MGIGKKMKDTTDSPFVSEPEGKVHKKEKRPMLVPPPPWLESVAHI